MSTRTSLRPHAVISAESMGASITSEVTILQSLTKLSYGVSWAAGSTPIGTLSIEVSNDYSLLPDGTVNNPGTWNTVTLSVNGVPASSVAVSGNTGNALLDGQSSAYAARLVYTRSSGGGTMSAYVVAKVS